MYFIQSKKTTNAFLNVKTFIYLVLHNVTDSFSQMGLEFRQTSLGKCSTYRTVFGILTCICGGINEHELIVEILENFHLWRLKVSPNKQTFLHRIVNWTFGIVKVNSLFFMFYTHLFRPMSMI